MGGPFIWFFFFGALLFLLPICVAVDGYADVREKKCWFALSVYRLPRLISGYLQPERGGIAVHFGKKKAFFLPFSEMAATRKKFEIAKGFQLIRYRQVVETGGAGSPYSVLLAAFFRIVSAQVFSVMKTRHPFLSLESHLLLVEGAELKVSVRAETVLNGLVLTVALAKKLLEVLLNWIREEKSTVSWKRQRSN